MEKNSVMEHRFFLQEIDTKTNCPINEHAFSVNDAEELLLDFGLSKTDPLPLGIDMCVEYANDVIKKYNMPFKDSNNWARLRKWHRLDNLPYRIHTDRELIMMLQRVKPLAVFDHFVHKELIEERFFRSTS